jgi:hypothetical protein
MRDIGEHVQSGLRIAGWIVLVLVSFVVLEASLLYVTGRVDPSPRKRLLAALLAVGIVEFVFVTTRYWARWLFAAIALAFVRLRGGTLFGLYPSKPVDRSTVGVWLLYAGVAAALTFRYSGRKPRELERLGLVSFVVCIAFAAVSDSQRALFVGLGLLGLAELAQWLRRRGGHSHDDVLEARSPE